MTRLIVFIAALALLPAIAHASPPSPATARAIALQRWGPAPCGDPRIVYDDWTVGEIGFSQPIYTNLSASPCAIHLSPDLKGNINRYDAMLRCHTIVHEWGHLTGHPHSHDVRDVMFRTPHRLYWRCRR